MRATPAMRREEARKLRERTELVQRVAEEVTALGWKVVPQMDGHNVAFIYHGVPGGVRVAYVGEEHFDRETLKHYRYAWDMSWHMSLALREARAAIENAAIDSYRNRLLEMLGAARA